ncbi:MAG: hypothetical protein HYW86_03950 [Candidatus Roizmanbacteria bacterium]|nr:MAG: hypothetical protein HYW86_03950 [Candidatus Roizmanbacteria bacterium]
MNTAFLYAIAFNIVAIPFVIYIHMKGECQMITQIFIGAQPYCSYITNPFINLLSINAAFFIFALLAYANSQIPHVEQYNKKPPTGPWPKRRK